LKVADTEVILQSSSRILSHAAGHNHSWITAMILKRSSKICLSSAGIATLGSCASPQQRAIAAYCDAEGFRTVPQQLIIQQVIRPVYMGERTIGSRNKCKTETKVSKNKNGDTISTRETKCVDEPITESVYKNQLVNETVDLNGQSRQNFVKVCVADAIAKGMYSHLK